MTGTSLIVRERARQSLTERVAEAEAELREMGITLAERTGPLPEDIVVEVLEQGALVDPIELAALQTDQAYDLVTRDLSRAVSWGWEPLDALLGPMLPGELWLIGATTGNGKSTFLHNLQAGLAARRLSSLVFPLEVEPELYRLRSACWQLNISLDDVLCHDWDAIGAPEDEVRRWVAVALENLRANPFLHVAPTRRVTIPELHKWIRWGVEKCGAEVVVVDHLHRFEVAGTDAGSYRVAMTELARNLRDVARSLGVVILCAVQLNRERNRLDDYEAPDLWRIKEASAIAEEAAGVLMLSRDIDPSAEKGDLRAVRAGRLLPSAIERKGAMVVTCRKHRRRGRAKHRSELMRVTANERLEPWYPGPRLFGREVG
ncbi:MAG: DnaB-like helicase C-terminal domain-containing protein [Gemmatimonadales bacterium]